MQKCIFVNIISKQTISITGYINMLKTWETFKKKLHIKLTAQKISTVFWLHSNFKINTSNAVKMQCLCWVHTSWTTNVVVIKVRSCDAVADSNCNFTIANHCAACGIPTDATYGTSSIFSVICHRTISLFTKC